MKYSESINNTHTLNEVTYPIHFNNRREVVTVVDDNVIVFADDITHTEAEWIRNHIARLTMNSRTIEAQYIKILLALFQSGLY